MIDHSRNLVFLFLFLILLHDFLLVECQSDLHRLFTMFKLFCKLFFCSLVSITSPLIHNIILSVSFFPFIADECGGFYLSFTYSRFLYFNSFFYSFVFIYLVSKYYYILICVLVFHILVMYNCLLFQLKRDSFESPFTIHLFQFLVAILYLLLFLVPYLLLIFLI